MVRQSLVAAAAAMVSACIPSRLTVRQGEGATVVDAASHRPIAGADLTLETWQVYTPMGGQLGRKSVFRTKTDAAGHFSVPEQKEWFVVIPIPDLPPAFNRRLCIAASGYEIAVADPWAASTQSPWSYEFPATYALKPLSGASTARQCPF